MVTLVGSPAAAAPYRSLASVFVVGADNAMYQLPQIIPNGGWGQWINRGTPAGVGLIPSPAVSFNNFIDIFGINPVVAGGDGSLYAFPLTNETGPWTSLGGNNLTNPSVGVDGDGLQAVFALWAVGDRI